MKECESRYVSEDTSPQREFYLSYAKAADQVVHLQEQVECDAGRTFEPFEENTSYALEAKYPATVSPFLLDTYEVTGRRFSQFADAWLGSRASGTLIEAFSGKHAHLDGGGLNNSADGEKKELGWLEEWNVHVLPDGKATLECYEGAPDDALPARCVNWYEAYAFCIWDGGFLPTEAEWNFAAAGGRLQYEFPWGDEEPGDEGPCLAVFDRMPGLPPLPPIRDTCLAGTGRWGHVDLAGNMAEWTLDAFDPATQSLSGASDKELYAERPCNDCAYLPPFTSETPTYRVLRGGTYQNPIGHLTTARRNPWDATGLFYCKLRGEDQGFRCARSP